MDADTQKKLREPFAPEHIGKLPRVTCGACSRDKQNKHCGNHQRARCNTCGNYITTAHMHLDYAGHAAITDRLLSVDPTWSWEPLAIGPDGLPVRDREGGLWIRLTVAGVTRLGYGDAEGKAGPSAVKEAIGDALRNAAMRFGVGLDLWHKDGTLHQDDEQPAPQGGQQQRRGSGQGQPANGRQRPAQGQQNGQQRRDTPNPADAVKAARGRLGAAAEENRWDLTRIANLFKAQHGHPIGEATDAAVVDRFREYLFSLPDEQLVVSAPATSGAAQ